jgi:amidophosphoribosyltransferase
MCGIVGIYSHALVAHELYDSLIHLQHRGQDAAGILTYDERFYVKQGRGLVRDVLMPDDLLSLKGHIGLGHTRYPTAGGEHDLQPLWVQYPHGVALAHNGHLTNTEEWMPDSDSGLDSALLLRLLGNHLADANQSDSEEMFFHRLCQIAQVIFTQVQGSYSVVSVVADRGLVVLRDPHGIRPLVWGERCHAGQVDYIFASENTAFYALGFELKRDVQPGEVIYINKTGQLFHQVVEQRAFTPCLFEYVYFARPDAVLDHVSVYRARLRMGQNLARQWRKRYPDDQPDVVIPAPFTANTAALSFAHELGVRYSEGLYKNPFIGRTFIMPNQATRSRHVRYKLTPQRTEIKDKKVLIVDDSIVRGTTSCEIVKMVREFGAKAVYFASSCPPIKHPCFYGIDLPSRRELIAAQQTEEGIRAFLGVDRLLYQTQDGLIEAVTRRGAHHIKRPCMACMDGHYVCGQMTQKRIDHVEQQREMERKRLVGEEER